MADDGGLEGNAAAALVQSGADLFGNDHDEHSTYAPVCPTRGPEVFTRRWPMSVKVCVAGDVMLDVLVSKGWPRSREEPVFKRRGDLCISRLVADGIRGLGHQP